ncbi:MAG: hypothetical protein U5O39_20055 [Gammaproteobacteria bacterium]|nr:hypothetical protein [Gammaproteobacteria bacterium]
MPNSKQVATNNTPLKLSHAPWSIVDRGYDFYVRLVTGIKGISIIDLKVQGHGLRFRRLSKKYFDVTTTEHASK